MEFLIFVFAIMSSVFFQALGFSINWIGLGYFYEIALMGSLILWYIRNKK